MQLMTGDVKLGLGVRRRGLNYMGLALLTTWCVVDNSNFFVFCNRCFTVLRRVYRLREYFEGG